MIPLSVITVGVGKWDEYTFPFLQSVIKAQPTARIVCIDNGATYPDIAGIQMVRHNPVISYAAGINSGINAQAAEWYMVCNNDVTVDKPFAHRFAQLDTHCLYGFAEYTGVVAEGVRYLSGWMMLISQYVIDTIGLFDENYAPMWFEDADYSYRATKAGIPLVCLDRADWGFHHIEDERMSERVSFMHENMASRHINRAYFRRKHGL